MEILVFATNVNTRQEVESLRPCLNLLPGIHRWNFDLDDCDRVLRVETLSTRAEAIRNTLSDQGFFCTELE
jgi:hypothetical protein